eukprot:CAMPEP_0184311176 /NCGR_PEP_ID=MMETSP1049-20130417/38736_1 /TAXON_ID=77928 /ORGANISM="Proteomonas sulcata, Strain CCMP704" /LENGTH=340 /DNA_ID=CAMNT_0026626275 /DNA_START=234 /DNA_END=1256 /DNA_ORIENTATION=+
MGCMKEEGAEGLGHLFMMDKLTANSPPAGKGMSSSVLGRIQGTSQLKPSSKFDAQTGKFYRSFRIDASGLERASVGELLTLFAGQPGLDYDAQQHSGVVVSMAGGEVSVLCVGETHVHCDFLVEEARRRLNTFLTLRAAAQAVEEQIQASEACGFTLFHSTEERGVEDDADFEGKAHSMAGFTLFSAGPAHNSTEPPTEVATQVAGQTLFSSLEQVEPTELLAEQCSGLTLFAPLGKAKDHMIADSIAGFTLLSHVDEDYLSEKGTEEGSNADAAELDVREEAEDDGLGALSNKDLKALFSSVADTCAGLTFFSAAQPTRTEAEWDAMQAQSCGGVTLFA